MFHERIRPATASRASVVISVLSLSGGPKALCTLADARNGCGSKLN